MNQSESMGCNSQPIKWQIKLYVHDEHEINAVEFTMLNTSPVLAEHKYYTKTPTTDLKLFQNHHAFYFNPANGEFKPRLQCYK